MTLRLADSVVLPDGEVLSLSEVLDRGLAFVEKVDNFLGARGQTCTKYFVTLNGTRSSWEIGKLAYLSRTGQKIEVGD